MLALSLEARWVVRALAAPEFFDAYKAVPLVSTGVALYALYLVLSVSVGAHRAARSSTSRSPARPLAVNIGLNLVLVPPYGLVGAGIALVGAYVVMIALMYGVTRRIFPARPGVGTARCGSSGSRLRCSRLGELLLPDLRRRRVPSRAALVALSYLPLLWASGFFQRPRSGTRCARAIERARGCGQRRRRRTWKPCAAART